MGLLHVLHSLRPRLARPKTFLGFIPLQMGTEIISATLFFNKLTGAYGLLAILTGFSLSLVQLSAYIYNLAILILLAICFPHIRRETPLPNIALAWAYAIDTFINAAYTATFAIGWYLASSSADAAAAAAAAATSSTVPAVAASSTVPTAVATSASSLLTSRNDATAMAAISDTAAAAGLANPSTTPISTYGGGGWMSVHETAASLTLIIIVTVVRFYFCLIVVAHARQALQRYGDQVVEPAAVNGVLNEDEDEEVGDRRNDNGGEGKSERDGEAEANDIDEEAGLELGKRSSRGGRRHQRQARSRPSYPSYRSQRSAVLSGSSSNNPFAPGSPAGEGWKGRLGRALVGVGGQSFWLGRQKDDEWTRDISSRFRS